jgi:hypothetical protein
MNYRYLSLLTTGHLVTDVNQGALPALLPFLISEHKLSYGALIPALFFFAMNRDVTLSTLLLVLMGLATVFLTPNRFHEIIFQLLEAFQSILTTREKNGACRSSGMPNHYSAFSNLFRSSVLNSRLRSFPTFDFGSMSRNSMYCGTL